MALAAHPIRVALGVLILAASLSVVGCGSSGPSKAEIAQQRAQLTRVLTREVMKRERQDALRAARSDEAKCRAQLETAISDLSSLNAEATWGVTFTDYANWRDELDTELNRIPRGALDRRCLTVLKDVEDGANVHRRAYEAGYSCAVTYANVCDLATDKDYRLVIGTYWGLAHSDIRFVKKDLKTIGTHPRSPKRPSPFLPRTEDAVGGTIFGTITKLLCGSGVPQKAVESCQALRDVLANGVTEDEESELNDALSGIVTAYGLDAGMEPPATTTQPG